MEISQSSHKIYSNNILNFQESTTILNAHTKKVCKLTVYISYNKLKPFNYVQKRAQALQKILSTKYVYKSYI